MTTDEIATTLKEADEALLEEILREAEARLSAQLEVAVAADQRAMTFLGFVLTVTTFLLGAAIAALTASTPSVPIAIIATVGAVGFGMSSFFAYRAARPIDFEFVGNDPSSWLGDVIAKTGVKAAKAEQCAHYDGMLKSNREAMANASKQLVASALIASVTVGLGAAMVAVELFLKF